jgi:hypothetical protein
MSAAWHGSGWAALALSFVVQPVVVWLATPKQFAQVEAQSVEAVRRFPSGMRMVVLAANDFVLPLYGVALLAERGVPLPKTWHALSMGSHAHRVIRTGPTTFSVQAVDGRLVDSVFESNVRDIETRPFVEGQTVTLDGLVIRVESVDAGLPTRIGVTMALPLGEYTFLRFDGQTLTPVTLPEVGHALELPRVLGLFEQVCLGCLQRHRLPTCHCCFVKQRARAPSSRGHP